MPNCVFVLFFVRPVPAPVTGAAIAQYESRASTPPLRAQGRLDPTVRVRAQRPRPPRPRARARAPHPRASTRPRDVRAFASASIARARAAADDARGDGVAARRRGKRMNARSGGTRMRSRNAVVTLALVVITLGATLGAAEETYDTSAMYERDDGVTLLDLHGGLTCFEREERHERPDVPEELLRSTIALEVITSWDSQRVAALALGILLSEKLGYKVEYKSWDTGAGQPLLGSMTQTGRQYVNVLKGKSIFDLELWPISGAVGKQAAMRTQLGSVSDYSALGEVGQVARNGWFLNADAVGDPLTWHSLPLLNASGAFDPSSSLHLTLSMDLPVTNLTDSWRAVDKQICPTTSPVEWYGGRLDCAYGSWAPLNATCCTRYLNRTNSCAGLQPCVAIVSNTPAWLRSEHERRVLSSGLPLEIVYTSALATAAWARNRTAHGTPTPVIFYWWEPDLEIPEQTYIRLALQEPMYCSSPYLDVDGNRQTPSRKSNSYAFGSSTSAQTCDFTPEPLEKGGYEPARIYFSDAFYLVEQLQITFVDIQNMLQTRLDYAANYTDVKEREFRAACTWLKTHEASWKPYILPNSFYFDELWKVGLGLIFAVLYVFVQQQLIFKRGGYYDSQVRKCKEVLSTMEENPIFMLDRMEQRDTFTVYDGVNLEEESRANLPELSFRVKELHVGSDEYGVKLVIVRTSAVKSAAHGEIELVSKSCKLGTDFQLPIKLNANDPGRLYETARGSGKVRIEFEQGQNEMALLIPLVRNMVWSPSRNFFVCMKPAHGDNMARIFPIDCLAIFVHEMGYFPEGFRLTMTDGSSFSKIFRFMLSFLDETVDLEWILPLTWRYQLANCIMAWLDTFVWSYFFTILVNEGLLERRSDWCILIAMIFILIELFRYHIGLHYFPGSYVLQSHLEVLLGKKFSSLSTADLEAIGSAESLFRVSASTDTNTIRVDLWAKLHASLIQTYRLLGSAAFIAFSFKNQADLVGYTVGAVGFVFLAAITFIMFRIRKSYIAGIHEDELEVMVYDTSHYLYRNTGLVRESHTEVKTSERQYEKLWLFLDGGVFERWYLDYFNKWTMTSFLVLILSLLYGFAPQLLTLDGVTVGMFIAIVSSLSQLGNAVITISENFSIMLSSVSKVAHMSELLNIRSSRSRRLQAMHKIHLKKRNGEDDDKKFDRNHEQNTLISLCPTDGVTACIYIDRMTLLLHGATAGRKTASIFQGLSAFDKDDKQVRFLPAGGFIGLRQTRGTFSKTFMNILAGTDVTFSGVACVSPRFGAVTRLRYDKESILMNESLLQNLTLGLTLELSRLPPGCRRSRLVTECVRRYDSHFLWKLCKLIDLTPSLLGETYRDDWAMVSMTSVTTLLDSITVFKITYVQAILMHPDVILVDGFGDDFSGPDLESAVRLLRLYESKQIPMVDDDSLVLKQMNKEPRTVVWHGSPWSLLTALKPHELVMNITSKSRMTVMTAQVAFNGVKWSDASSALAKIPPAMDIVNPVGVNMLRTVRSNTIRTLKSLASSRAGSAGGRPSSGRIHSRDNKTERDDDNDDIDDDDT